jgi:hypothetical protein
MARQFHGSFPKDPPLSFHHKSCKVVTFSKKIINILNFDA